MNVTFKWKLIGSDAFEQSFYGKDLSDAIEHWSDFWGIDMTDCEVFSFYTDAAQMQIELTNPK
jgi:hypothetical protein